MRTLLALLLILLPLVGHAQAPTAPPPAAGAGFNTLTFGPNLILGKTADPVTSFPQFGNGVNWVPYTFTGTSWTNIGAVQNTDGSVTIDGTGESFGNGITTAAAGNASVTTNRLSFTGQTFGGGGYFQAVMKFTGPASFWANDIETMNGVSVNAGPNAWPGQAAGYGDWIEADFAEFDATNLYGIALHNWYNTVGSNIQSHSIFGNPTPSPTPDYTAYNTFGFLWTPATTTTQGSASYWFHAGDCSTSCTGAYTQVGTTLTWNKYDSTAMPPPTPATTTVGNGSTFSVMDNLHLALILGAQTGGGDTNTIKNVQVWQANGNSDLPPIGAAMPGQGAALPSGYLNVSGNQIQSGTGNNVRIASTTYRGTPADTTTMPTIRTQAKFNAIVLPWYDHLLTNGTSGTGCNTFADMDLCVSHAQAAGLKVIFSHRGNEGPTGACASIQQNGLWFDKDPATGGDSGNADGCGASGNGTVTYATFKANTVALMQRYNNNSTVIGYELHHAPLIRGTFTGTGTGSSGTFSVKNGQVMDPSGNRFAAYGLNIADDQTGALTLSALQAKIPKLNFVRYVIGAGNCTNLSVTDCNAPIATSEAYLKTLNAAGIVTMVDPHYGSAGTAASNVNLYTEATFLGRIAADLKSSPFLWIESGNELVAPGLTIEHVNIYNAAHNAGAPWAASTGFPNHAVRNKGGNLYVQTAGSTGSVSNVCTSGSSGPSGTGTGIGDGNCTWDWVSTYTASASGGFSSMVVLCTQAGNPVSASGTPDGPFNASTYGGMTNVMWDMHWYNWETGGDSNQTNVNNTLITNGSAVRNITSSLDGVMPVGFFESGQIDYVCNGGQNATNNLNGGGCGSEQIVIAGYTTGTANFTGMAFWLAWFDNCCSVSQLFGFGNSTLTTLGNPISTAVDTVGAGTTYEPYIDAGPGPITGGGGNQPINWGGSGDTDIRLACSDVGAAVNAVNSGVILFCPAPLNNGTALLSGGSKP